VTKPFDVKRAAWVLATRRQHDRELDVLERAEAIVATMVEFQVRSYARTRSRAYRKKPGAGSTPVTAAGPLGAPPLERGRLFPDTPWEEFELLRVVPQPQFRPCMESRRALVPEGCLVTGGDRAWRCEVVP
jgi:hypothetical protein